MLRKRSVSMAARTSVLRVVLLLASLGSPTILGSFACSAGTTATVVVEGGASGEGSSGADGSPGPAMPSDDATTDADAEAPGGDAGASQGTDDGASTDDASPGDANDGEAAAEDDPCPSG